MLLETFAAHPSDIVFSKQCWMMLYDVLLFGRAEGVSPFQIQNVIKFSIFTGSETAWEADSCTTMFPHELR